MVFESGMAISGKSGGGLPDAKACTGCGACAAICPQDCIRLVPDDAGFLQTTVDGASCVDCGLCTAVCPVLNPRVGNQIRGAYWAVAHSGELLQKSSSGGVFGLLAQEIIKLGGVVCGAAFSSGWREVRHVCACTLEGLEPLYGSKYVQSKVDAGIYADIEGALSAGRWVLFSGTGCQIAGMRAFLGDRVDTSRLLCVEVVCHGAPSPKLWSTYLDCISHGRPDTVRALTFRSKDPSWMNYSLRWRRNAREHYNLWKEDWYLGAFIQGYSVRPCCFACSAKLASGGDLLLGDFWGIDTAHPEVESAHGVSAVVVHTEKGEEFFARVADALECGPSNIAKMAAGNPSITTSLVPKPTYRQFMKNVAKATPIPTMMKTWKVAPTPAKRLARHLLHKI